MTFKRRLITHFMTDHSMGASFNSNPVEIALMDDVGVQLTVSAGATPVGVLTVQVSNDHQIDLNGNVLVAGNWATVQSTPGTDLTLAVSGNTGVYYFDLTQLSAPFFRVVYTRTSGTGTMNGHAATKSI